MVVAPQKVLWKWNELRLPAVKRQEEPELQQPVEVPKVVLLAQRPKVEQRMYVILQPLLRSLTAEVPYQPQLQPPADWKKKTEQPMAKQVVPEKKPKAKTEFKL